MLAGIFLLFLVAGKVKFQTALYGRIESDFIEIIGR